MYNHKRQKEADWQATHLDADAWSQGVLDGTIDLPSWESRSRSEVCRDLRNLGMKSSYERKMEKERTERIFRYWAD